MEQVPKATEPPKPKSRTMFLAIIVIAILAVVGVGVYILTLPPKGPGTTIGARVTIYDAAHCYKLRSNHSQRPWECRHHSLPDA